LPGRTDRRDSTRTIARTIHREKIKDGRKNRKKGERRSSRVSINRAGAAFEIVKRNGQKNSGRRQAQREEQKKGVFSKPHQWYEEATWKKGHMRGDSKGVKGRPVTVKMGRKIEINRNAFRAVKGKGVSRERSGLSRLQEVKKQEETSTDNPIPCAKESAQ